VPKSKKDVTEQVLLSCFFLRQLLLLQRSVGSTKEIRFLEYFLKDNFVDQTSHHHDALCVCRSADASIRHYGELFWPPRQQQNGETSKAIRGNWQIGLGCDSLDAASLLLPQFMSRRSSLASMDSDSMKQTHGGALQPLDAQNTDTGTCPWT
jgi:hypothetical protein